MKNLIKLAFFGLMVAISSATFATPPQSGDQLGAGYYVVVAAYRAGQSDYAQKFVDKINQGGMHASFGLDATRNLIYVYLAQYSDFNESIREMEKTRQSADFSTAWVRVMPGSSEEKVVATKPKVEKKIEEKPATTVYVAIPKEVVDAQKTAEVETSKVEQTVVSNQVVVSNDVGIIIENPKAEPVYIPQTLTNTPIFMSLFNSRNGRPVDGEIEVIDTERSRSITKVKGNSYLTLPDPKSKSGQLTLVCNAFGYRKVQHEVNFKNTEADTLRPYVDLVGNFYLVKFDLVRLHKGDISTLYNVYFFTDAAIMRPESKYELTSLLQMMQDNPNYKIMLHGHTNGNARGDVMTMGPSKNFFALTDDVVKGTGTAKELSTERAKVIKDWLVSQGIAEDRMQIKAWGGGRMIHDKESVNAQKNVRVEVEVLEE